MGNKLLLLVGAAAGYILGARAGRERYDQIADQANKAWSNPKVQEPSSRSRPRRPRWRRRSATRPRPGPARCAPR